MKTVLIEITVIYMQQQQKRRGLKGMEDLDTDSE